MKEQRLLVLITMVLVLATPAISQSSPADGPWSGSIQCQLDVQQQAYSRRETQTWTLVSSTPTSTNGAMSIYAATWTASGQGELRRALAERASRAQWTINAPATNTAIAMFIRASDGKFIIRLWQAPHRLLNGVTGARQMASPQQSGQISSPITEWSLPWIETTPDANLSGTFSVPTESLGAELSQPGPQPAGLCNWQFVKGNQTPDDLGQNILASSSPVGAQTTSAARSDLSSLGAAGNSPAPTLTQTQTTAASDNTQSISTGTQATFSASSPPPPTFDPSSLPVKRKTVIQRVAPTGFTAKSLDRGAVQFSWQPVNGTSGYHLEGTGIASSGVNADATSTGVTIQNVPPGPGTWKMAAVYENNSWDSNLVATASEMVRYTPSHSPPWLSKNNGPGSSAAALAHYRSLCPSCSLGDTFQKFATTIGMALTATAGGGSDPYGTNIGSSPVTEARYTNVTDLGSARATICLPSQRGQLCYSKSGDQKLSAIVMNAQLGVTWFLTFNAPSPTADIFDYRLSDQAILDSEGPKFAPHACLACHGGQYDTYSGTGLVMGSTFLPLDPGLLEVSDRSDQNGKNILAVNQAIVSNSPGTAVARYLTGLYSGDPLAVVFPWDEVDRWTNTTIHHPATGPTWGVTDFAPQGWSSQAGLYRQVVKPHCIMCHLASSSSVDFSTADKFLQSKALVYTAVCSAHSMPHAELPFKNFWTKDTGPFFLPGVFAAALGYQSCP